MLKCTYFQNFTRLYLLLGAQELVFMLIFSMPFLLRVGILNCKMKALVLLGYWTLNSSDYQFYNWFCKFWNHNPNFSFLRLIWVFALVDGFSQASDTYIVCTPYFQNFFSFSSSKSLPFTVESLIVQKFFDSSPPRPSYDYDLQKIFEQNFFHKKRFLGVLCVNDHEFHISFQI